MVKILIIDNDQSVASTVKSALELNPTYQVDICLGANLAGEYMKKNPVDLILLDFMMPEISGVDFAKTMSQDNKLKQIPVILISALPINSKAFQEANDNFQETPVIKGLLEKPFGVTDLLNKVEDVLKK